MLIGVMSDIHDHLGNLRRVIDCFQKRSIDTVLFLGDFCSPIPARAMSDYAGRIHCVFGNGDGDRFALARLAAEPGSSLRLHGEHAELDIDSRRLALTHYPLYGQALARTGDYAAVFSGHTHAAAVQNFGAGVWANPGDIPGLRDPPSYALYETSTNEVEIHSLQGDP